MSKKRRSVKRVPRGVIREYERNKRLVLAGETYRSRKPSDWKIGRGPGRLS